MLLAAKLVVVFSVFFILNGSSLNNRFVYSYQHKEAKLPIVASNVRVMIDETTGKLLVPHDDNLSSITFVERLQLPKVTKNYVYSKTLSPVEGGGVILNMGVDSFSYMRVVKDNKSIVQVHCSAH